MPAGVLRITQESDLSEEVLTSLEFPKGFRATAVMASSLPIPGFMNRPGVIVAVAIAMGFLIMSRCHHHPVPSSAAVETAKQTNTETSGRIVHREVSYGS